MVNTPSTHHRKHVSKARVYKHAKQVSTQVRKHAEHVSAEASKHAKHVSTQARKHAKHVSAQARQARNLADSKISNITFAC